MKRVLFYLFLLGAIHHLNAQVATTYTISFENAVHHEAFIEATFTDLKSDEVEFRMSRTSPGRYALHEFVKMCMRLSLQTEREKRWKGAEQIRIHGM